MVLSESHLDDPEVGRTVELLGGRAILRRSVRTRMEAHDLLIEGLPGGALKYLMTAWPILKVGEGLEKAFGISRRTYQRRKEEPDKPLSPEQSGRAWKFAEILGRAIELFGSRTEAEQWLERPAMALDDRRPIDLLSTPAGVETVEDHLTRLEYGAYT